MNLAQCCLGDNAEDTVDSFVKELECAKVKSVAVIVVDDTVSSISIESLLLVAAVDTLCVQKTSARKHYLL
jgi:hypothetical protein